MRIGLNCLILAVTLLPVLSRAEGDVKRETDVVYGRKYGTALTMDVFRPEKPNGAAVIYVVSGGWYSSHDAIRVQFAEPFLKRGFTVFAVVHGSQPKFTIPEILGDMHRAVRFIRNSASEYGIDPDRLGICGASAGGHLSLMQGAAGTPGDATSKDPVEQASSRVQAVACFFPPTDFLNYGKEGEVALGTGVLKDFWAPFDFQELTSGDRAPHRLAFEPIDDSDRRLEIGRSISPVYHASEDDPPTLIIHGDADRLVPIQQAELMIEALEKSGVEAKLIVRKGMAHGWPDLIADLDILADWFEEHLAVRSAEKSSEGQ